ncbi:hypothetical protein H5410_043799 [Solanum commersonii]|uniref:Transducin/WD40 repeat-like superfamily protein n=1 Tax=Solanum commersonii TaxID=4109 RepID=A0A9J5XZD9_SOLCO|nr:hypothetical protein H5410_043799 [Solanum commersonii]
MKCKSIACIWSGSPPVHKVTAVAALNNPPTLYTGGSDGSIIWWNISSSEITPVAMLCGHVAPIADLGICVPTTVLGDGKLDDSNNVVSTSNSSDCGALLSACTDGVLCIWSRASGQCRRRRKMPPWVGMPYLIRPFPENRRYVCIACCSFDHVHLSDHHLPSTAEKGETFADRDSQHAKPVKCTVAIVDTYTLAIVQTVFHGSLSIGPLKSVAVISSFGDVLTESVMMVDSFGKSQCIPILNECDSSTEKMTAKTNLSDAGKMDWVNGSKDRGLLVAFANRGPVLAFVYGTYCIFSLLEDGSSVGEIYFSDDLLPIEGKSHAIGGMFVGDDNNVLDSEDSDATFIEKFVVWNGKGAAIVYRISYTSNIFKYEPFAAIPVISLESNMSLSISFVQVNNCLFRVESNSFPINELLIWKPHLTCWVLPKRHDKNEINCQECRFSGESRIFDDWTHNQNAPENEIPRQVVEIDRAGEKDELTSSQDAATCSKAIDERVLNIHKNGTYERKELVSSSMVISEEYVPLAIVYGFYNGDIKVVRFDMFFEGLDFHGQNSYPESKAHATQHYLLGHTGAVLCLASQRVLIRCQGGSNSYVLISGSMDCTIRVWDLDSSSPMVVMHQHVAPVRQIVLPPSQTELPWSNCFLSVGEDSSVALSSFDSMRVERIFPGHPYYPAKVVWDSRRGYIACLCPNQTGTTDADVLYIWDVKSGARERVLRGSAAVSMFDHFCTGIDRDLPGGSMISGNTSASSLLFPATDETRSPPPQSQTVGKGISSSNISVSTSVSGSTTGSNQAALPSLQNRKQPVKGSCPFPGVAALSFDLTSLMSLCQRDEYYTTESSDSNKNQVKELRVESPIKRTNFRDQETGIPSSNDQSINDKSGGTSIEAARDSEWMFLLEKCLLQFSLSILHMWNVDAELDELLVTEMKLKRPQNLLVASGLLGDRGSLTLTFPDDTSTLELWKSSSEYCAMRSLTMVSLAQHMISLSHSFQAASRSLVPPDSYNTTVVVIFVFSSSLSAFYMRSFAEKVSDIKPPQLQLLVSFWQDEAEHVKMAARSLFHCAASRAIPPPLRRDNPRDNENGVSPRGNYDSVPAEASTNCLRDDRQIVTEGNSEDEESEIRSWLESFEMQDWISCVGGMSQDAMTSHIIVAAALAVWYPSLVKPNLFGLAVNPLVKLVMAMNEKYSSTAAEILAEGMESTWKACIGSEIPRLIGDIFFQIECVTGASANSPTKNPSTSVRIRDTLVGVLLPSLAMADVLGFLNVIERQIWSTASDSPVHIVSLMTIVRVARGSPRNLVQYLDKIDLQVVTFILQTIDPGNLAMRKTCLQSSMVALKEIARIFPMVALNDPVTRLAIGDAIGEINSASIRVYDMQSITKIKVLDASGPPGFPSLLGRASGMTVTTVISALSFSPDGEVLLHAWVCYPLDWGQMMLYHLLQEIGLVAFSETGLMIRWWSYSLGSVWWEKLNRNLVPVQCMKLIFVPPWEGFSPNASRSSLMESVFSKDGDANSQENTNASNEIDRFKQLLHNIDLSYRLEWVGKKKIKLAQHGRDLGTFQL